MSDSLDDILATYSVEQLNNVIRRAEEEIERKKVDEIQQARRQFKPSTSRFVNRPCTGAAVLCRQPEKPAYARQSQYCAAPYALRRIAGIVFRQAFTLDFPFPASIFVLTID